MTLRLITLATAGLLTVACTNTATPPAATEASIANKTWQLASVDGKSVKPLGDKVPQLILDSNLKASGVVACNNFFGQAKWKEGQLRIENMGITMMMCPPPLDQAERDIADTLSKWSKVTVQNNQLTLTGAEHVVIYTLAP